MHVSCTGGLSTIPGMDKTKSPDTGNQSDVGIFTKMSNVCRDIAKLINFGAYTGNFHGPARTEKGDDPDPDGAPSSKRHKSGHSNSTDSDNIELAMKLLENERNAQIVDPKQLWNQKHKDDCYFTAKDVPSELHALMNINTLQCKQMIQDDEVVDITLICFEAVRRRNENDIRRSFTVYTPQRATKNKTLRHWYTKDEFDKLNTEHLNHCMHSGAVEDWMCCPDRAAASSPRSVVSDGVSRLSPSPSASSSAPPAAAASSSARDSAPSRADARAARDKVRQDEAERQEKELLRAGRDKVRQDEA